MRDCATCAFWQANARTCWHPQYETTVMADWDGEQPHTIRLTGRDCQGWLEREAE